MPTIGFSDLRKGAVMEIDGQPYEVLDYQKHKMQQRAPVTRIKMRNLFSGAVTEKTFQAYHTTFTTVDIETRESQYLYNDGSFYHFMDLDGYEQFELSEEKMGDSLNFLKDQAIVEISFYKGTLLSVKMPTFVNLIVSDSPPGLKGDTAQGGTKPATLETGFELNVPLFIKEGETIKVDTRTGTYVERANS